MKQLLSLFLFLLPCLALAQYPSNGNQKITLGEQSTADGLIWRGVLADTGIINPSSDTSAYIILDTVNHRFYNYNRATNVWSVAGGGTAVTSITGGTGLIGGTITSTGTLAADTNFLVTRFDTTSMLTNYWRSGNFSGTLPVESGGTNTTTLTANKVMVGNGTSGVLTPTKLHWDNTNSTFGIGRTPASNVVLDIEAPKFIGRFNSSTGTNAAYILFANTATNFYIGVDNSTGGDFSSVPNACVFWVGGAVPYIFATSNAERMRITDGGEVWMGYTTDQGNYRLQVKDSLYIGGNVSASAYTTRSDYNLKDDIFNIKYGLNDILKLQPVEYTYKSNGSKQLGFIAQDIGTILPEVVSFEESMSVNYQAIIPILTKAIQEQQALIKALEQRIINLENK